MRAGLLLPYYFREDCDPTSQGYRLGLMRADALYSRLPIMDIPHGWVNRSTGDFSEARSLSLIPLAWAPPPERSRYSWPPWRW